MTKTAVLNKYVYAEPTGNDDYNGDGVDNSGDDNTSIYYSTTSQKCLSSAKKYSIPSVGGDSRYHPQTKQGSPPSDGTTSCGQVVADVADKQASAPVAQTTNMIVPCPPSKTFCESSQNGSHGGKKELPSSKREFGGRTTFKRKLVKLKRLSQVVRAQWKYNARFSHYLSPENFLVNSPHNSGGANAVVVSCEQPVAETTLRRSHLRMLQISQNALNLSEAGYFSTSSRASSASRASSISGTPRTLSSSGSDFESRTINGL